MTKGNKKENSRYMYKKKEERGADMILQQQKMKNRYKTGDRS